MFRNIAFGGGCLLRSVTTCVPAFDALPQGQCFGPLGLEVLLLLLLLLMPLLLPLLMLLLLLPLPLIEANAKANRGGKGCGALNCGWEASRFFVLGSYHLLQRKCSNSLKKLHTA